MTDATPSAHPRFYVFDSDGNTAMEQKGYSSLSDAVDAASYLVLFVWPDPERAMVGREDGPTYLPVPLAYVEMHVQPGNGRVRLAHAGDALVPARIPRITYTHVGLDALVRALPHSTVVCQACGSHDVDATAWVDAAGVVREGDGPLDGYYCNGCQTDGPDVIVYSPGDTIPPHVVLAVLDVADDDTHKTTLAEFLQDNESTLDADSCSMLLALRPGESLTIGGGASPLVRVTREGSPS